MSNLYHVGHLPYEMLLLYESNKVLIKCVNTLRRSRQRWIDISDAPSNVEMS